MRRNGTTLAGAVALALLAILGLAPLGATATSAQPGSHAAPAPFPDEVVQRMLQLALKNINRAACDGFNPCAPATPMELKHPPITLDQARAALAVGVRTAVADWCGLDSARRSVVPMQKELRKLRLSNRQMALIAVVHSIQQSITGEQLKAGRPCDAGTRKKLDAQLPKR